MGENIGNINLGLDINKQSFNKQLSGISKGAESSVKSAFSGLGKKIGLALGTVAVGKFVKNCLDLGSDLAEVQNVVDVTFGSMSDKVNEFASTAMSQFGLSETVTKKMTGTFGSMAKAFGFSTDQALDMSETLTGLSADVASFYNLSTDEAYTKIKSVFTGETESLKELGVVMTQTALDQYAINNGFGKTTKSMTEQEKVMLRYQFVQSQLAAASGDFSRTSGGWANQVRVLSLRFDALKATLGQGFINLFTPIVKMLNTMLAGLSKVANAFVSLTELITGKKAKATADFGQIADAGASTSTGLNSAADGASNLSDSLGDAGKAAKKAAKDALGLSSFDKLNNMADNSSDSSKAGSGTGGIGEAGTGLLNDMASSVDESGNKINSVIQKIINKFKKLSDLFKQGFKLGLGDLNFKEIKSNIKSIGKSLKNIFTDPKVLKAANNWLDSTAKSLGKVAGSYASVALTIAEFVSGSIEKYLNQNKKFIKDKIVSLLDISKRKAEIYSNFTAAVADIFTVFRGKDAKQIGADLIAIFANSCLNIVEICGKLGTDLMSALTKPIIKNRKNIKAAIENTLKPIRTVVGSTKDFIQECFDAINKKYDQYIKPALDDFSEGWSKLATVVLDKYNKYIAPALQYCADAISEVQNKYLAPLFDKVLDFFGTVAKEASNVWKKTLEPILEWVASKLAPIIKQKLQNIVDKYKSMASTVSKVLGDITTWWKSFATFLSGLLTRDIGKTLEGLKGMFSSFWKEVKDIFSGVKDYFKTTFGGALKMIKTIFEPIATWFKDTVWAGIKKVFENVGDWFKQKFDLAYANIKKAFSNAKQGFSAVWSDIKNVFTNTVEWFGTKFTNAYNKVKSAFLPVKTFFRDSVWGEIKNVFTNTVEWFGTKFANAWGKIKSAFSIDGAKTWFENVWASIKGAFSSVSSWFYTTFYNAWARVKNVFSTGGKIFDGIKDGIGNVFKTVVNRLIEGINRTVSIPFSAINGMLNKIHDVSVLGVKPFSGLWDKNPIRIPQIPKLAQGAYVKANTPQLAMIGDNRHQGEIVAPENKLQELLDEATSKSTLSQLQMTELLAILRDILRVLGFINDKDNSVHIGDTELGQSVQRFAKAYKKVTGKEAFT